MIGIIGAMQVEIAGLKDKMEIKETKQIAGISFYSGTIHGVDCVLACCSPGKVNAAVCAQCMILEYHPSLVINSGVAGGIGEGVHMGDLVVAESVVQHDMDTSALGDPKGYVSGPDITYFPASAPVVEAILKAAVPIYAGGTHQGIIATGDQFIGSNQKLMEIRKDFGAICCEMEGGSIGHTCYLNQVPFAVIRTISDNGNDDAAMDFLQFSKEAAEKSTRLLYDILPALDTGLKS